MKNPNCDNDRCRTEGGEVRRLPCDAHSESAVIVCLACYAHEMNFRQERNRTLEPSAQFPRPAWETLAVYQAATEPPENPDRYHEKLYRCKECGYLRFSGTNHWGETYSWQNVNTCPICPPFKRPNTWECAQPRPPGGYVPEPWTKATIVVKKAKARR
jgi:hypothetical protein